MTQVPMRMQQPGLVPQHQQRPPMMVSMTQPPPVTMQGLVSIAPIIGPGGGMAVMTQAMTPDTSHDHSHHHSQSYHPIHHTQHATNQRQTSHHRGAPQQTTHSAPHSQYHSPHPRTLHHPHMNHTQNGGNIPTPQSSHLHMSAPPQHVGPSMGHHAAQPLQVGGHSNTSSINSQINHQISQPQHSLPPPLHSVTHPPPIQHQTSHSNHQPSQNQHRQQSVSNCQAQSSVANTQSTNGSQQGLKSRLVENRESNIQPGSVVILSNSNNRETDNSNNLNVQTSTTSISKEVYSAESTFSSTDESRAQTSVTSQKLNTILSNNDGSDRTREKTPMCLINELARYNKVQHQYRLTDEKGPAHKKSFTVTLKLGENEEEYTSSGASIKKAQHMAAALALEQTKFNHPPPKVKPRQAKLTPTVELNTLAMKRGEVAQYTFLETPRPQNPYAYNMPSNIRAMYNQKFYPPLYPLFCVNLRVGTRDFTGEGPTAQHAKHNAAYQALKVLKALPMPEASLSSTRATLSAYGEKAVDLTELDPNAELKSPISLVHELALKRGLTVSFEVIRESGPPHMRIFATACIVGDIQCQGEGTGKKCSKKRSAELMLEELRRLPPIPHNNPNPTKVKRKASSKKKGRNLIKESEEETKSVPDYAQSMNPISRLIQIQQAKKEKEPLYKLIAERGVPRRREFVMQVTVGSQSTQGTGPNKKLSKRAAAESMLQLLGYSRPSQPAKTSLKSDRSSPDGVNDKTKKQVTFVEEQQIAQQSNGASYANTSVSSSSNQPIPPGSGRQLVPGLIMMPDGSAFHGYQNGYSNNHQNVSQQNDSTENVQTTATIAKELLESGSSSTAKAIKTKTPYSVNMQPPVQPHQQHNIPQPTSQVNHQQQHRSSTNRSSPNPQAQNHIQHSQPSVMQNPNNVQHVVVNNPIQNNTSVQAVRPKDQLMYLASILNLQVQFTDFPKGNKGDFLSLVSLSTMPPHVSHGAGPTLDASHDLACLTALRALAEMGLDTVTPADQEGPKTG